MFIKSIALAFSFAALTACSGNSGPNEDQVKQALYDHYVRDYANPSDLKEELAQISVKQCEPLQNGFLCEIGSKQRTKSEKLFVVYDKDEGKWKHDQTPDSYRN